MERTLIHWMNKHRWRAALLFLAFCFVGVNFLAYQHAHSMTHFRLSGERTPRPEELRFVQKVGVLLTGVTLPRPRNQCQPELPYTTHRFSSDDGIELEAWHVPAAKSAGLVLLFHGYGSCKAELLPEALAFHELGYNSVLVDFRGSGGSEGNETTLGVREASDVHAAIDFAKQLYPNQRPILYGFSMGGVAILRAMAMRDLQAEACILACPFDRLTNSVGNRFRAIGLPAFPCADLLVFWGGLQHGFDGFAHNPAEYARRVRCPTLLTHGEADARVTKSQAEAIYANLGGKKQFELFERVGHESQVAACPEQWQRAVSRFLAGLD